MTGRQKGNACPQEADGRIALSGYTSVLSGVVSLLDDARRSSARAVNALMTETYWEIGRRIVEWEQGGRGRARYGSELMAQLSRDLIHRFGRGFGQSNLFQMRAFYLTYPEIFQTVSGKSAPDGHGDHVKEGAVQPQGDVRPTLQSVSKGPRPLSARACRHPSRARFPLPWSHYVALLRVKDATARRFYEGEALRGGWTVRQLKRQIGSQFYERTLLSRDKASMLMKGARPRPGDGVTPEEEIKDPFVLEFLGLRDEYSESELEEALVMHLEQFLLELGGDFAFVGRQRRLRVGDQWFRLDLLFFHRRLRCLVVIELKLGEFTPSDVGQMLLYLNYAREHWARPGENPPVGLVLCASRDAAVARYTLDGVDSTVLAAEYRTALPDENELASELARTRRRLEGATGDRDGPPDTDTGSR